MIKLAIYSKNNLKKHNRGLKRKIGIALVSVFSVLLLNLLFNIIPFINSFFLGTFGLMTYPLFVGLIIFGSMFIADKFITVNGKALILFILLLIFIIALIHLISTKKYLYQTYAEYLKSCYNSKYTAAGLIFGIIVYPVSFLTHFTGSIVFFAILLTIITALIIDMYIFKKHSITTISVCPK